MSASLVEMVHFALCAALAGVLWTVQLAIYPLFDGVATADFVAYHRRYTRAIGPVVIPLMFAEAVTAAVLWAGGPRPTAFTLSLWLLGVAWVSTFAVQVPLHRRLSLGFETKAHRLLVRTNWVRTIAWTLRAGVLGWGMVE